MAHNHNANQQAGHGEHPTPATYIKIAFLLAALTGIEVGVFYIDALEPAFLPIFLILSIAKFALVILFYMHLKFDHRLFSTVFIGGLMLALVITVALLALFQALCVQSQSAGCRRRPRFHHQRRAKWPCFRLH